MEAEKGRISDAFKRAAVHWGVGRYLYNLPNVWVPLNGRYLAMANGLPQGVKLPPWALPENYDQLMANKYAEEQK